MLNQYKITYWNLDNCNKETEFIPALTAADALTIAKEYCSHFQRTENGITEQSKMINKIEAVDNA